MGLSTLVLYGSARKKGAGLFDDFRAENLGIVTFSDTDNRKAADNADTVRAIHDLAEGL